MTFDVGIKINAEVTSGRGIPIVFLHGWGTSSDTFNRAIEYFSIGGRRCVAIDFPLFGKSEPPPPDWSLGDYTDTVEKVLNELGIDDFQVVGHSFGGRVAIDLATRGRRVQKMVLVSSAGVKPRRTLKQRFKAWRFKIDKAKGKDVSKYYSEDWRAMPDELKGVFSRIVSEDLTPRLSYIKCPTLLLWGNKDKTTPLYMAKIMKANIAGSQLKLLKGGHFAYATDNIRFINELGDFLGRVWKQC